MKKTIIGCLVIFALLTPLAAAKATEDMSRVIVVFKDKPKAEDFAFIEKCGGKVKRHLKLINAGVIEIPAKAIEKLKKNPRVKYVEPDIRVHAFQEVVPWGVDRIDADVVWTFGNKGVGVNVCVIDTGIDYTHPDLDDNYKGGYDFVNDDLDPLDDNGHGTHCAGIIAAENNTEGVVGVAPGVNLYAVKVLNRFGSGWLSDIVAGIEWAVDNNMDVISMSLGTSTYSSALEEACNAAYEAGLVLVAAAGNEGDGDPSTTEISYPAAFDSVIAVGATDEYDNVADFSNTGEYLELAAPGVNILSTMPTYRVWLNIAYGVSEDYAELSGTSMACPHVAGVAALIIAANPGISNVEVRQILQQTADDVNGDGWDSAYGYGLVDADEAAGRDTLPPTISDLTPADGAYVNSSNVTISAKISDVSGINESSIVMLFDGDSVIPDFNSTTGVVSYYAELLSDDLYSVYLEVSDTVGNTANASWNFTVDTNPPTAVTNVTVTAVGSSELEISWNAASDENGVAYYNVYRSENAETYELIATTTNTSYLDSGLQPNTTYYYKVTAVDVAGNEGGAGYGNGTTIELTEEEMFTSIDMYLAYKGINSYAVATVHVYDSSGNPVSDATVYGHWEGAVSGSVSGITDASGEVTFVSDRVKRPPAGTTFTFVIDDVVKDGYVYAGGETSESVSV